MNYSDSDFDSSDNTDDILCDILKTDESNMYSSITYTLDSSSTSTTTMAGLARHNVPLFNGLALGSTDAVQGEGDSMDQCLTHCSPSNNVVHAHSLTPCGAPTPSTTATTVKPGLCADTGADCFPDDFSFESAYWSTDDGDYGSFYGIAKDGHVIYGPYNINGELWSCDDLDVCNGFWLTDGAYAYASTSFFPYLVGCFGPGPTDHSYYPSCSTNACDATSVLMSSAILLAVGFAKVL